MKKIVAVFIGLILIPALISGCRNQTDAGGFDLNRLAAEQENWSNREGSGSSTRQLSKRLTAKINATDTLPQATTTLPGIIFAKTVIVIDPGHGNPGNPGATGPGGILEKDVVLDVAYRLKTLLERDEFRVIMTRTGSETALGNPERAEVANKNDADLFVRIHADSNTDPALNGTRTLWYRDDSLKVAQIIQKNVVMANGLADLGVRRQYLVGFFYSRVPSVAVELAFLSNPREEKLLADSSFQQLCADGIYRGILEYFDWLDSLTMSYPTSTLP